MPRKLADKWEKRLHDWALWAEGRGPAISCAYEDRVPTGRKPIGPDECIRTDDLLDRLRKMGRQGRALHAALVESINAKGTRGEQAQRLGVHPDTYRARIGAAHAMLETMLRHGPKPKPTTHPQPLPSHAQAHSPTPARRNPHKHQAIPSAKADNAG